MAFCVTKTRNCENKVFFIIVYFRRIFIIFNADWKPLFGNR